jgi:hypothetical protein
MSANTVVYRATDKEAQQHRQSPRIGLVYSGARGLLMLAPVREDEVDHIKHDRQIHD